MVVFAPEFGSDDPFADALGAARWMAENDANAFYPHMGIASGPVTVGYVGTPLRYNCSAFGAAVTLASRCAGVKPQQECDAWIAFPADEWAGRDFATLFPLRKYEMPDGSVRESAQAWRLYEPQCEELKNLPPTEVRVIAKQPHTLAGLPAVERARMGVAALREANRYWPHSRG